MIKAALIAAAILAAVLFRRRWPVAVAGGVIFLVAFLPVCGVVPFDYQQFSTVADHYLYLSMLGPAMIASAVVEFTHRRQIDLAAMAIVAALAIRSAEQNRYWASAQSLMQHAVQVNPGSALAQRNLGLALMTTSPRQAVQHLRIAAAIEPRDPDTWDALGLALQADGESAPALFAFRRAAQLGPQQIRVQLHLAQALDQSGDRLHAQQAFELVLTQAPNNLDALVDLAALKAESRQFDQAIALYHRALAIKPDLPVAQQGLQLAQDAQHALPH